MNILEKAKILSEAGKFDSCGPKQCEIKVKNNLKGLYHSESENKNCVMLKTLMTNTCSFDCAYCPNSTRSKNKKPVSFTPDELVKVFNNAREKLAVNGLFLSSGIPNNPENVMENMLEALHKIRKTFRGYIHLKIMPGTPYEFIKRAKELANRVSINIESPNSDTLKEMSDCKDFKIDILRRQAWIKHLGISQSTQMIIRKDDTDKDVLKMSNWEYEKIGLKRIYYSAFNPVKNTVLENKEAETLRRQNTLYKADFLLREYNFKLKELLNVMDNDMLPYEDPKVALARNYFSGRVDINEASYEDLIRIPGIGLTSASRILSKKNFKTFNDLRRIGVNINRASPYIEVNGKQQTTLVNY